jgi:diadenosine tetraphosphatase ApaH/serine/threonine PP2A family protein phosphatase
MIWAILADVHGNLEALQSVGEDFRAEGAERIAFLGDAVGYGANPNECLAFLKELTDLRIAGNHDSAAVGRTDLAYFNPVARAAIEWTRENLSEENRRLIEDLPLVRQAGNITLVHSSLDDPAEWNYILTTDDAAGSFLHLRSFLAFIGHSHRPILFARERNGRVRSLEKADAVLEAHLQYIINVGSVGQPRDHDPRAAYGLYDDASRKYRLKRVPYDLQTAQEKIIRAGLPPYLARRLATGQ